MVMLDEAPEICSPSGEISGVRSRPARCLLYLRGCVMSAAGGALFVCSIWLLFGILRRLPDPTGSCSGLTAGLIGVCSLFVVGAAWGMSCVVASAVARLGPRGLTS